MCELQFIKRLDNRNLTDIDAKEFIKLLQFGSIKNSDAFGLFNSKIIHKAKGIVNLKDFNLKNLKSDNFTIGHNRYTTQGSSKQNYNNHPFNYGDFILAHNGVLHNDNDLRYNNNIHSKIETDSYVILRLIHKYFKQSQLKDRQTKIIKAIKKSCEELEGSFSVFLYDKTSKDIFYFKNEGSDFYLFNVNNQVLIGTTHPVKINYAYLEENYQKPKIKKIEVKNNSIYLVNDYDKWKILDQFENKPTFQYQEFGYGWDVNCFKCEEDFIDDIFKEYLGFVPEYSLDSSKTLITIRNSGDTEEVLRCFGELCKYNNGGIEIYVDDLQNIFYEYGH